MLNQYERPKTVAAGLETRLGVIGALAVVQHDRLRGEHRTTSEVLTPLSGPLCSFASALFASVWMSVLSRLAGLMPVGFGRVLFSWHVMPPTLDLTQSKRAAFPLRCYSARLNVGVLVSGARP
jgi:hypothetical protein